jgi:phosphopantetheinyl transferase
MPLTNSINLSNDLQILIWDIEESLEVLKKNLKLSEADKVRFQKRKITAHQKEFLASRRLLMEAGISPEELSHDTEGIPHLKSGQQLSISHTRNLAGIAYGSKQLGLDLECYREKIINIAPRFLHPQEDFATNGEAVIQKLTLIWTAKEALYKALKQKGIIFSKQFIVSPFIWGVKSGSAKVLISDQIFHFYLKFIVEKTYCATLAIINNP